MVGQVDRKAEICKTLKVYILRDREKQRLEDEAEAEKTRKKKEQDEKKLKDETEYKATEDKIIELTKKHEQLMRDKIKIHEHLKKLVYDNSKYRLEVDDAVKLYGMGGNGPHYSIATTHQPTHPSNCVSISAPRNSTVSVNSQFKPNTTVGLPIQTIQSQKRNRSPSPNMYRSGYAYKQHAGPHPFQKLDDSHRNHEYARNYPYSKPSSVPPSGNYSAFYSPGQTVAYTHPSQVGHGNAAVYSSYSSNRDNVEALRKSHSPPGHPPSNNPPHTSLYATHRSSGPQQPNHIYHGKGNQGYADDKYYMVRQGSHVPVHSVIPIQPPQGMKHGSITAGYPVRPVATQIHIQPPHGGHHSSQQSHHGSQSSHHSSLSGHHPQSQSLLQSSHSSHHPPSSVHYSHHSQPQSSQSSHPSQQPPSSVSSHHPNAHHIQSLNVSHHGPPSSHHQLLSHHSSSPMHHSSTQPPHMTSSIHHGSHHPSQSLHHQQMQPHIQQHISSHQSQSQHPSGQQSQSTSIVTSQAYANQISAIQGGSRVVYSQSNLPH